MALIAAIGTFDGVHLGHRFLIDELRRRASLRGEQPAVVTFRRHPLEIIRPERVPSSITPLAEKLRLLEQSGIERVIVLDFDDRLRRMSALSFVEMLAERFGTDALMLGYDTRLGSDRLTPAELSPAAAAVGVEIFTAGEMQLGHRSVCSSDIRRLISSEGDVSHAAGMLGRHFELTGTVVHGARLGRTLGFPTANLVPADPRALIPRDGVYAAWAVSPALQRDTPAVVNIGVRPTVDGTQRTIEAHMPGVTEELYGKELTLRFVRRIRDEKKFSSLESLKAAIAADTEAALTILNKQPHK